MSETQKNLLLGGIVAIVVAGAVAIIAQTSDVLQAFAVVFALAAVSLGITYLAIVQARRSATKGLQFVIAQYRELGRRALFTRYPDSLLELPVSEQVRLFERVADARDDITAGQLEQALGRLRSGEFANQVDRIRFSLEALLGSAP